MAEKKPTPTTRLKPERIQSQLKSERVQDQLRPERVGAQLKSERVQSRLKPERVQTRLRPERIQAQLEELSGWELAGDGRALERTYLFPTIRAAVAFVALVAEIGEAEGYVPDVDLRHLEVTLRVATSTAAGVTDLDFDVARSSTAFELTGGVGRPLGRACARPRAATLRAGRRSPGQRPRSPARRNR